MRSIKLLFSLVALMGFLTFTSCGDDDEITAETPTCTDGKMNGDETGVDCGGSCEPCTDDATCDDGVQNGNETGVDCGGDCNACTEELGGSIGTRTLDPGVVYIIDRFAYVDDGDVLTIPAGTILKANDGQGADASALIVARGGKIDAKGEPDNPIIFTSVNDDIQPGETESTIDPTTLSEGQWGGLIILGRAPVSVKPGNAADGVGKEGFIEGVPSSFSFSKYGGDNPNDDSGTLDYVSIRYTGSTLSTDEEIQGLTLGGVGSDTDISNIEIYSSFDDGVEFFGGNVDVTNLLVAYQTDDAIDIDQSYDGVVDNAVVLLFNPETGNDGMEIDGPEAPGVNDGGMFTINNTTIYQKGSANIARFKSNAQGTVKNFAARDFDGQTLLLDGANSIELMDSEFNQDENTAITDADSGSFTMDNVLFSVSDFTKGADESVFGWTFSKSESLF